MALTLTEIIDDVCAKASIDKQNQASMTNLIRWVNIVNNDICNRFAWPWMNSRTTISTVVDTEGTSAITVACTQSLGTLTGTGTTFVSTDVGRFIQFSSSNDWYKITAVASTTSATIEPVYALTTESGMDFTIRTFTYDLPSDLKTMFDVRQYRSPQKLVQVDTRTFDTLIPDQTSTGSPRVYTLYTYSNPTSVTGQQYAIGFYPIPSAAMVIEVRYLRKPPSLSVGTDISIIPSNYQHLLIDGTLVHAYQWTNNPSTGGQKKVYEDGIKQMKSEMPPSLDLQHVIQAVDQGGYNPSPVQYPSQYGWPYNQ